MAVGLQTGPIFYTIGSSSFLHSFFSTISYHLEDKEWGDTYPIMMNKLYQGKLLNSEIPKAKAELKEIQSRLKNFSPDKVIWNIEDLSQQPPWGNDISEDITDLSNYFVTSDGRDLFDVIKLAFDDAMEIGKDIEISSL